MNILYAYLAGIIDGEGTVGYENAKKYKYFRISVEMTSKEIIDLLYKTFGGYVYCRDRSDKPGRSNHKLTYRWNVSNKKAIAAYSLLEPYLILKKIPKISVSYM